MRLVVTGGAGFIGSNFVRYMLADMTTFTSSTSTCSPTPAISRTCRRRGRPALQLRARRHLRRARVVGADAARRRRRRQLRRRDPRRPLHQRSAGRSCSTDVLGTHTLLEAVRRLDIAALRAGLHRRGVRHHRPTARSPRPTPLRPSSPYSASKAGADLWCSPTAHVRHAGAHHPQLEQLRPVPVPREDRPAVHYQRPGRAASCRCTATACTCATGCTWRTTAPASPGAGARARRARSTTSAAATRCQNLAITHQILELLREGARPHPLRDRPARARPPLRRRLRQARAARLGAAGAVRDRARAHGGVVREPPRVVAAYQVG